jgi:hypothetical protein
MDPDELEQIAEPRYHQRTVVGILTHMQLRIFCICHKISSTAADTLTTSGGWRPQPLSRSRFGFFQYSVAVPRNALRRASTPSVQKESLDYPSEFRRRPEPAVPAP